MKEYTSGKYDTTVPAFVFRQYYDSTNKKLIPEKLESQYYGEKVLNPDEELMANSYLNNDEHFMGDAYDDELLNKRKVHAGGLETVIPVVQTHSAQKTESRFRLYLLWTRKGGPQEGKDCWSYQAGH